MGAGDEAGEDVARLLLLLRLLVELLHRWLTRTELVDVHLDDRRDSAAVHALNADGNVELVRWRPDRGGRCLT